jgi:putative intracellular protease/amidase
VTRSPARQKRALILIAPGFEEEAVVCCLSRLREAGIAVSLVGLSASLVRGEHGLAVRPDTSLERLLNSAPPWLVLVPGGAACASALMADPRVHQLLAATASQGGQIAATFNVQSILANVLPSAFSGNSLIVQQNDLDLNEFAERLVNDFIGIEQGGG